jgi:hypothetical protein
MMMAKVAAHKAAGVAGHTALHSHHFIIRLGSDRGVGDKGGERPVVRLDLGRGPRLTRSVDT